MSSEENNRVQVVEVLGATSVQKAKQLMRSRSGLPIMAAISFVESALPLPILTDPFLVAAILLHRAQAVKFVIVTTLASVAGGVSAYYMATYFFDMLLGAMNAGVVHEFNALLQNGESSVWLLTLIGAITPIPYTIVAWVLAVLEGSILIFIIGSILGRGFRYAVVGYCTYRFGPLAVNYAKRYVGLTSVVLIGLAVVYFLLKL